MKKILITTFITFLFSGALIFNYAQAVDFDGGLLKPIATQSGYQIGGEDVQLSQSVGRIIRIALSLVGMIFFALAIYAGFLWMTASGNEEQVTKAISILKAATIGLIIALAAFSITTFITSQVIKSTQTSLPAVAGAPQRECFDGFWGSIADAIGYATEAVGVAVENTVCLGGVGDGLICTPDEFEHPC